jgi:uracil-DNA glycosylase
MSYAHLPSDWAELLSEATSAESFTNLQAWLSAQREVSEVYPPQDEVYTAFHLTPFDKLKVVILGQDPYHGEGQGHGLSFSVKPGVKVPPSLRNMYKELESDLGVTRADAKTNGDLRPWAEQGVLLLNTVLTVRASEANSHRKQGWERFTDEVIKVISERKEHVVFILWGKPSQLKAKLIDEGRHTIIASAHPSPLSAKAGFFGSKPYSQANTALTARGQEAVDWSLS